MPESLTSLWANWSTQLMLGLQIILILFVAYAGQRFLARALTRLSQHYHLPPELLLPLRGGLRWFIMGSAIIMVLERLGVSATVLWTAVSGFVAVAAVAFFAMWSVLSNLLCAVMILTVGPFRLGDVVELIEASDKTIIKGRVTAINLMYTTLKELPQDEGAVPATVQIPNSLFFQKVVKRWRGEETNLTSTLSEK